MKLLLRILIAIGLGILFGQFLPEGVARIFATFNAIFSQFLGFCIPLIIIAFIAPSIGELGKSAGKMLAVTAALAYLATLGAGFFSYFTSSTLFPRLLGSQAVGSLDAVESAGGLQPFFTIDMPPIVGVMTALILAFVLGFGVAYRDTPTLKRLLGESRDIVSMIITAVIIPLLPIYIFGIFLDMTVSGEVASILLTFSKIIGIIFAMHIVLLLLQYTVAALFSRHGHNPLRMLWTMLPAYFTALGTQSSAATIPVTLRQAKALGVDPDVAGFTVPLCATIHLSGSTLKIVACAMALMLIKGQPIDFGSFAGFIAMLGIAMVAAPGVPGGAIMASLGVLSQFLGFTDADNALMIALYISMDSFGTACNVTGDGAITIIVDRFFGRKISPHTEQPR